jgi:hypothetical protein
MIRQTASCIHGLALHALGLHMSRLLCPSCAVGSLLCCWWVGLIVYLCGGAANCFTICRISSGVLSASPLRACGNRTE